jgi:cytochrome bd-type quinol oxidase subunit 2
MKLQKLISCTGALATVLIFNPVAVLAQGLPGPTSDTGSIANVDTARFGALLGYTPSMFLRTLINVLMGVSGVVSFIFLLWGGLQWILAGGDKEGTEKARKKITSALIGLAIVFSAYALLYILRALFNVNLIQFELRQIGT